MRVHAQSSLVWRVLTTPMGPRILPRLPWLSGVAYPARVVEGGGLPEDVAGLVRKVAEGTRLWRAEQVDVARELCTHFSDGLATGKSAADLIAGFGDAGVAARLIRRAKKRGRPLWWRVLVQGRRAAGVLIAVIMVVYGALTVRFLMGSPTIARNYSEEIAAPLANVPEQDRAWPLYHEAIAMLGKYSPEETLSRWGSIPPGDAEWAGVEGFLGRAGEAMELMRRGAAKPALGLDLRRPQAVGSADPGPVWGALDYESASELWRLPRVLREDALGAAARGDAGRVVEDLTAIIRMAGHCAEVPFSMIGSQALQMLNQAMQGTNQILATYPGSIPEGKLVELAHRFASFGGGGSFRIDVRGDRMVFLDLVQRSFTDDGRGGGRMIGAGWTRLASYSGWPRIGPIDPRRLVGPWALAVAPGRREVIEAYDRADAAAVAAGSRPMYAWTMHPDDRAREVLEAEVRYVPNVSAFLSGMGGPHHFCEVMTQRRDATLVAIGLELYSRAHGGYPERLEQLVPVYLPAVPIDRFDGRPVKYLLRAGRPVVYSVGGDRTDNGGFVNHGRNANSRTMYWYPPGKPIEPPKNRHAPTGFGSDWILWPPIRYNEHGEVIVPEGQ